MLAGKKSMMEHLTLPLKNNEMYFAGTGTSQLLGYKAYKKQKWNYNKRLVKSCGKINYLTSKLGYFSGQVDIRTVDQ